MVENLNANRSIRVAVRVRPLLPHEAKAGHETQILKINENDNSINISMPDAKNNHQMVQKNFAFDRIINEKHSQQEVFE